MADTNGQKKVSGQPEQEEKKQGLSSQQKMILIIVGVVVLCATAVVIVWLLRSKPEEKVDMNSAGIQIISEENVMQIEQELVEKVEKGRFKTYMNVLWRFPDGKSASSNAVMGNSPSNNYAFYFTVTLSDTGEEVFRSGLLPVGTQIEEIKLTKELSQGTYEAVVTVNMMDENGEPVETNTGFDITLVVQN